MAEKIAGRFEIEKIIGYGGMGEVYRGIDTTISQPVAIKLLKSEVTHEDPDIVERFEREGEALRRLNHPNIVKMLASVEEDGKHYLVMEYVSGGSLQQLLRETPQLPIRRMLEISLDLADALTRAHRLKIIHRDIKPANVLLAEDGTPRLTDFGVARFSDRSRMTQTGSLVGTYAYLSPEACNGEVLDERADIWSFGVMMFEMLVGKRPFDSEQPAAIILKIMSENVPDLQSLRPDAPPELVRLIYEMLEKDHDLRLGSVREVGTRLEKILRTLEETSDPIKVSRFATPTPSSINEAAPSVGFRSFLNKSLQPLPGEPAPRSDTMISLQAARSRQRLALLMGVVLTLVVLGVLFLLTRRDDTPAETEERTVRVEPVAPGEYMVLVAELERVGGEERSVTRLLVNELTQTLEKEVPFSNFRVRAYPKVLSTPAAALAAAETNGAAIVVWGNYDANVVNLELQMGVTSAFPYIDFPREMMERTANVSLRVIDPQTESIAPMVIRLSQILESANGNAFNMLRNIAVLDELEVNEAEVTGGGVSAQVQRFFEFYLDDTEQSLEAMNAAIDLDAGNPLLYTMRGIANYRLGRSADGRRDAMTGQRLGGEDWVNTYLMLGNEAFYINNDLDGAIEQYNKVIELRPDDWFALTFRGVMYYAKGDYSAAKTDLDRAIALGPEANWPYIYAALLALREGRLSDAQYYSNLVVTEFPDPTLANRGIVGFYGNAASNFIGLTFSAAGNMLLGRYSEVLPDIHAALAINDEVADLYLVQGFAQCNLGDIEAAAEAYTRAIRLDPDFAILYLLRAEAFSRSDRLMLAIRDLNQAGEFELGTEYDRLIEAARAGNIGCETFFNVDLETD